MGWDGMGMGLQRSVWGVVRSGHGAICMFGKKGVPWTIQEIKHFPIMIGMTDQRK